MTCRYQLLAVRRDRDGSDKVVMAYKCLQTLVPEPIPQTGRKVSAASRHESLPIGSDFKAPHATQDALFVQVHVPAGGQVPAPGTAIQLPNHDVPAIGRDRKHANSRLSPAPENLQAPTAGEIPDAHSPMVAVCY
jgi:hypothetical protein